QLDKEKKNEIFIDIGTLEIGFLFDTFAEAHAAIKNYAAKTNTMLILGKTSKNPDSSGYRQAYFVCEKQKKYSEKEENYTTKRTGYCFCIGVNYRKRTNKFVITKSILEHNHEICLEATKFSTAIRKFNQNDLGLIEKLSDDGLRAKDIFSVLSSVNLSEIEVLLKTLKNDNNIIGDIALKPEHNDEHDQDGEFIQAVFWAYRNAIHEFAIAKDVLIIDATYKTNRFSMPLLNKVLTILTGDAHMTTIITDRELALIATTSLVFPYAKHQLCIWHLFKNIQNKLKKDIEVDKFISDIQKLIYSNISINQINEKIEELWK
ncbi:39308_t:CDS:2, partial [Gigaspora margarita]